MCVQVVRVRGDDVVGLGTDLVADLLDGLDFFCSPGEQVVCDKFKEGRRVSIVLV